MIPTYVFGWPSGQETGDYLAVDLGGTNFRVCLITLLGGGKYEITQSKYRLTEEQKQEDGKDLFDFCARCVAEFIEVHTGERDGLIKPGQEVPLGFTVSSRDTLTNLLLTLNDRSFRIPARQFNRLKSLLF